MVVRSIVFFDRFRTLIRRSTIIFNASSYYLVHRTSRRYDFSAFYRFPWRAKRREEAVVRPSKLFASDTNLGLHGEPFEKSKRLGRAFKPDRSTSRRRESVNSFFRGLLLFFFRPLPRPIFLKIKNELGRVGIRTTVALRLGRWLPKKGTTNDVSLSLIRVCWHTEGRACA